MSAQVGDGGNQVDGGPRANIQYKETPWERLQLQIEHTVAAARLLVMHLASRGAELVQSGELVQREVLRIGELADAIEETFTPAAEPAPSVGVSKAEMPLYSARVLVDVTLNELDNLPLDGPFGGTRRRLAALIVVIDDNMRAAEKALGLGGEQ